MEPSAHNQEVNSVTDCDFFREREVRLGARGTINAERGAFVYPAPATPTTELKFRPLVKSMQHTTTAMTQRASEGRIVRKFVFFFFSARANIPPSHAWRFRRGEISGKPELGFFVGVPEPN